MVSVEVLFGEPGQTYVTVAVDEAMDSLPLPVAEERTESPEALGVPEAVEEYWLMAIWQYCVPNAMTVCASLSFGQAWLAQSRTP